MNAGSRNIAVHTHRDGPQNAEERLKQFGLTFSK